MCAFLCVFAQSKAESIARRGLDISITGLATWVLVTSTKKEIFKKKKIKMLLLVSSVSAGNEIRQRLTIIGEHGGWTGFELNLFGRILIFFFFFLWSKLNVIKKKKGEN